MMDETREERRARLLETAFGVIQKQGIRKTTLDDIAAAAGMATTSMYYYFANKKELLRGVVVRLIDRTLEATAAAVAASKTPEEKLVATWRVLFSAVTDSGFLLNLSGDVKPELLALASDLIKDFDRRYKVMIRNVISDGIDQGVFQVGDIDMTVTVLSSGVIGLVTTMAGEAEYDLVERQIDKIGEVLAGLMVRNSILVVDFARENIASGMDVKEAVLLAGQTRLRPILLTASTVILGDGVLFFDPLLQGLGLTMASGALVSTALTLGVVPIAYYHVASWRGARSSRRASVSS